MQNNLLQATFVLLCFSDTEVLQIEGLWQLCVEQIYWHYFSNSICLLPGLYVCHILVALAIFQLFQYYQILW